MQRRTSVRLDAEAHNALRELMACGRTKSQAIRDALRIGAEPPIASPRRRERPLDPEAERRRSEQLRAEAEALMNDPAERAEIRAVRRDMGFADVPDDPE